MNANGQYRKTAKCTKCTEAEQHAQTAEAQSRDHAIQSELSQVSARDDNTRAERLAMEVKYRDRRLAEAERRAVDAERRPSDWNFNFPATVLEPLSYLASARLHREDSVHTQASSRLGQLLRPRRRGVERSDNLESGNPFFRFPDDT